MTAAPRAAADCKRTRNSCGGGPVVAKELAARGVDVLVLEAGPWYRDPENEWSKFEHDSNDPLTGYLRFGPSDRSKPAWFRETPQNSFLTLPVQKAAMGTKEQRFFEGADGIGLPVNATACSPSFVARRDWHCDRMAVPPTRQTPASRGVCRMG